MNRQMAAFLALESEELPFHHIHGAGTVGCKQMGEYLTGVGVDLSQTPELEVREYIRDMGTVMRAADLVLCRAGASTISELTALGVPAIIVPSPNVANNHQEHNARVLADAGGAVMLLEKDSSGQRLFDTACEILNDPDRREKMSQAMAGLGAVDAAERIYNAMMSLMKA
jgi:UDP-N-acetylglucosamine--N-acetylmuramyl-(pentapeptide) pyrophosphoryl-undecaprenol N-acetylglucosamine transferase